MTSAEQLADRAATSRRPAERGRIGLLQTSETGVTGCCARALDGHHPVTAGVVMVVGSWLVLSASLAALGLALSAWAFDGPLGQWDVEVTRWFEQQRNATINDVTTIGSAMADTITIVAGTALVAAVLLVVRYRREALVVILAPTIEVTAFLVATFVIDRDRPPVDRLDGAPPTSSFPSGHTAAAVALYAAVAVVVTDRVRSRLVRGAVTVIAVLVPLWVALSRLSRGMHHPTDVIVGSVAGLVCVVLAVLVVRVVSTVEAEASAPRSLAPPERPPYVPVRRTGAAS